MLTRYEQSQCLPDTLIEMWTRYEQSQCLPDTLIKMLTRYEQSQCLPDTLIEMLTRYERSQYLPDTLIEMWTRSPLYHDFVFPNVLTWWALNGLTIKYTDIPVEQSCYPSCLFLYKALL